MTGFVPLVETTRHLEGHGGAVENVHFGAVAVVDRHGRVVAHAGDPEVLVFSRSTLKPFQASPFVTDAGLERFGFGARELALMCASHNGETHHIDTVTRMLSRIGCTASDLGCGIHVPLYYSATGTTPDAGAQPTVLHHNCSGKHTGFLAWCRLHDAPIEGYLEYDHPLQVAIRDGVARYSGLASHALVPGRDGCSAPNYALPLSRLAKMYAELVCALAPGAADATLGTIARAMAAHPEMVSGTGRPDLAYMTQGGGHWIAKAGADGVQVVASSSHGLSIAIKIADGNLRALHVAMGHVLKQLGFVGTHLPASLESIFAPVITNYQKTVTGEVRPVHNSFKI